MSLTRVLCCQVGVSASGCSPRLEECYRAVAYPGIFFEGGAQQIQLRAEDRDDGDLQAIAPLSGVLEAAVIWYKKFHFI